MLNDDKKQTSLPIYHGGKDKSSSQQMLSKLGDGFRTDKRNNNDGSVTTVRTKGGMPDVTVTEPKSVQTAWAWPWHGLVRCEDSVIETPTGDIPLRGRNPLYVENGSENFNCVYTRPKGVSEFLNIPPPSVSPKGASWVNYATISNGILFGEYVGMNSWIYCTEVAAYVVTMEITNVTSCALKFYTLSEWVMGMPETSAVNFVKYDKTPHVFMTNVLPKGVVRTPFKTVNVTLPEYHRTPVRAALRIKRGDVSIHGDRIIIAYELSGIPTGHAGVNSFGDPYLGIYGFDYVAEDQWVELVIYQDDLGGVEVDVVSLKDGASEKYYSSFSEEYPGGVAGDDTVVINDKIYRIMSYVYSPTGSAVAVKQTHDYTLTKTNTYIPIAPKVGIMMSFLSSELAATTLSLPSHKVTYTQEHYLSETFKGLGPLGYPMYGGSERVTQILNEVVVDDYNRNYDGSLAEWVWRSPDTNAISRYDEDNSSLYNNAVSYIYRPNYYEWCPNWFLNGYQWGVSPSSFPGKRATYSVHPYFGISRHNFSTFIVSGETINREDTSDANPSYIFTPYGILEIAPQKVYPLEFTTGICIDVVGLSRITFDSKGFAQAGELVKFSVVDAGKNKTHRYI